MLSIDTTNIEYDYNIISPFGGGDHPATDIGTFDAETLTWNGLLAGDGECIYLTSSGNETGDLGDTVTTSVTIVSSVQIDDTINIDNSGTETKIFPSYEITELPNLTIDSHLITTGVITPTTVASYQIDVENAGEGIYHNDTDFFIFVFILPPDSTFNNVEDLNTDDALLVDGNNCQSPGTVGDLNLGAGLAGFYDRNIVLCQLSVSGDQTLPADNTKYPFKVNFVAGDSLAAGTADVISIVEGNDIDTLELMKVLTAGDNPVTSGSDNVRYLTYDPSALQANVNRCDGQGETTTDGTGCFTLTFNKTIYADSFGIDDIELGGVGTVDSLTYVSGDTWEVRVSGIQPGQVLALNLKLNQIQDYSAKQNSTAVLGINTIRFAEPVADTSGATGPITGNTTGNTAGSNSTSAKGTLAQTGNSTSVYILGMSLLMLGLLIQLSSKRKKKMI